MLAAVAAWLIAVSSLPSATAVTATAQGAPRDGSARTGERSDTVNPHDTPLFTESSDCMACHNSLIGPGGEDVSIGASWRASIMANSARDPYWQASVRRETIDHASHKDDIEDECAVCHMPMMRAQAQLTGRKGTVFSHLPIAGNDAPDAALAADGVSCTLCHQISSERLGSRESFVGRFVLNRPQPGATRTMFGPFETTPGRVAIMQSVTGVQPKQAMHVQQSELCATCHTLITQAIGTNGEVIGSIPEQVPYQEWLHSAYREERSCQSCHMPAIPGPTRMSSTLGELRDNVRRHTFVGGNFFMLRMLNRYRGELGVVASAQELDASAARTVQQLATDSAALAVTSVSSRDDSVQFDVVVRNLTGHKLPSGYPSRRGWLHVAVRDRTGRLLFESGAIGADGRIAGNDGDDDPNRFEPHYTEITGPDQVQIYESVMGAQNGRPTTGLLQAVSFLKDNRLLPRGFEKATADAEIAVVGDASGDADFADGGDRVRYRVPVGEAGAPLRVDVELRYQPIAYRWAHNLSGYDAAEPKRFVGYFESMAAVSSTVLARVQLELPDAIAQLPPRR
jgi:hypothetical protein